MPKKFKEIKPFPYGEVELYPYEWFLLITDKVVKGIYDYYCISTYGRVWHRYLNKFIKPGINGAGYLFFMASTEFGPKPVQIHRAVMMTFCPIPNPELFEVNHLNGNKLDPVISNLEWNTHKMNVDHAYRTNLQKSGEENVHSKITNEQAVIICELLQQNRYTNKEISIMVGGNCTETIVADIKKGDNWTFISDDYEFVQRHRRMFDNEIIHNLCLYFENNSINDLTVNDHCRNALRYYGYDCSDRIVDLVRKIYTRKHYTNISCGYKF